MPLKDCPSTVVECIGSGNSKDKWRHCHLPEGKILLSGLGPHFNHTWVGRPMAWEQLGKAHLYEVWKRALADDA